MKDLNMKNGGSTAISSKAQKHVRKVEKAGANYCLLFVGFVEFFSPPQ